ncbi:MAG TPA: hypothetical protein PKM25_02200 [Candidatus Ozemobacteraceae bacterium]|nr:hypothetical protein [Candidatus Ozemobacteraceae bacterium]
MIPSSAFFAVELVAGVTAGVEVVLGVVAIGFVDVDVTEEAS